MLHCDGLLSHAQNFMAVTGTGTVSDMTVQLILNNN